MGWDAIRTPTLAQLAALPCCASPPSVLFVPTELSMGNTRIYCYSKTPAHLVAGRLCHSAALAKSQAATALFLSSKRGLERALVTWYY